MRYARFLAPILFLLFPMFSIAEESSLQKPTTAPKKMLPQEIIQKADETLNATPTMTASLTMRIFDASGKEITRVSEIKRKRISNLENFLIRFTQPTNIEGVTLLVNELKEGETKQCIFYPELGRCRQIATASRNQKFMSSDFTYEDMSGFNTQGAHKLLRTENLDGTECYVIESIPKEAKTYQRAVSWIRKDLLLPVQVLFYQDSNDATKKLLFQHVIEAGTLSFPTEWTMEDMQNKTKTLLSYGNLNFRAEISDHLFTAGSVEQGIR